MNFFLYTNNKYRVAWVALSTENDINQKREIKTKIIMRRVIDETRIFIIVGNDMGRTDFI